MSTGAMRLALAGLCALMLVSCWFPEKFKAELFIKADGSYVMRCEAITASFEDKPEKAKKESAGLIKAIMEADPGYKKIVFDGVSKYKVSYQREGMLQPGEVVELFGTMGYNPLLTIRMFPDGEVEILGLRPSVKAFEALKEGKFETLDGTININVEGAEVMYSNSTEVEGSLHLWRFKSIYDRPPAMHIKLNKPSRGLYESKGN